MTDILTTSKNTSLTPYIYKVTNLETGQYYIGSQCSGKRIGVNYFTSSTNKVFRADFRVHGEEKYEIVIIKEFTDPEECVNVENYIIRNYMQKKDDLCLNRSYCCNGKKVFSRVGLQHSEETRKKMSEALKGVHPSEETRKRISETLKGVHHSEETRKRISETLKGRTSPQRIKISIEGTAFDSITEAAKYYNVYKSSIIYWIKNNKHNAFYITK